MISIYFNPHFREGSDCEPLYPDWDFMYISIHTSAREVTERLAAYLATAVISIHTSAREVTTTSMTITALMHDFNPHFREGSDRNGLQAI